eukprot:799207_1
MRFLIVLVTLWLLLFGSVESCQRKQDCERNKIEIECCKGLKEQSGQCKQTCGAGDVETRAQEEYYDMIDFEHDLEIENEKEQIAYRLLRNKRKTRNAERAFRRYKTNYNQY